MPILFVDSHHHSPKSIDRSTFASYNSGVSLNYPENYPFIRQEGGEHAVGIVASSMKAINNLLVYPEDVFDGYSYKRESIAVETRYRRHDELSEEEQDSIVSSGEIDRENPSRNTFVEGYGTGSSSIALIQRDSLYAKSMFALLEVLGNLPIIPVLQANLFDPKAFDIFDPSNRQGSELNGEKIKLQYPFGLLAYPKRIWPEFYSAITGNLLLAVTHQPGVDNDPHYQAFARDPRLGGDLPEETPYNEIVSQFRARLLPILQGAMGRERKAFDKKYPAKQLALPN